MNIISRGISARAKRKSSIAMGICLLLTTISGAAANPLVTDRFVADPAPLVSRGKVYVYATDDSGNDGKYWNGLEWRLLSSADMKTWRDDGAIFSVAGFKWAKGLAWAPHAVERDGTIYLYLPVDRTKIGVAKASSPSGPFTDAIGGPLVDNSKDANAGVEPIDPAVFVDDDGRTYMFFGTRKPKVVELGRDMISLAGPIRDVEIRNQTRGAPYGEAPWLHKRNGIYYLSYSTGWPGQIAYATSRTPTGPFTYRGIVLNRVNTFTNHQAIVRRGNAWYLFYHNAALPSGGDYKRSISVDRLRYRPDGTIIEVHPTAPSPTPPLGPVENPAK
jgi:beta-xylosidase